MRRFINAVVLYSLFGALGGCSNMLFLPQRDHLFDPTKHGVSLQDIYFSAPNGQRFHGWVFAHKGEHLNATVVFFHGNGQNISTHSGSVYWLTNHGFKVVVVDYRGYGRSDGEASLESAIEDIDIAIAETKERFVGSEPFVVIGHSLGASLAIYALANPQRRTAVDAAIMVSPFSDYHQIVRETFAKSSLLWALQWPLSLTFSNRYSPVKYVDRISPIPLYIFHGKDDKLISFQHSETLFQHAGEPKQLVELAGGHNDVMYIPGNQQQIVDVLMSIAAGTVPNGERRGTLLPIP